MKALILVGGFGTRLRPLTLSCPKPLVDFANKPMVIHQIQALKDAGVTEVILAINYQPEVMKNFVEKWEETLSIKIILSQETEPLGTAGPLALAKDLLYNENNEPFFVLNSDVICEYPLKDMIEFHKSAKAEGTILVTKVEDPSMYGVILREANGKINAFVEKPKSYVGNLINAGIYILQPDILKRIELKPTSIERKIFPEILAEGNLYCIELQGYWMDLGKPNDFLEGQRLHLNSLRLHHPEMLSEADNVKGNVLIDSSAKIGVNCKIGPDVCIGSGCVIGNGVCLRNCVIMSGVHIGSYSVCFDSIIGWNSVIREWCRVENATIFGKDVRVKSELYVNGAIVLPHKEIKDSINDPQIVL